MDKGDLKEYLQSFRNENRQECEATVNGKGGGQQQQLAQKLISDQKFYRMAAEISDGMLWLSEHKYIHRDLAARNCLIAKNDVIKIAGMLFSSSQMK